MDERDNSGDSGLPRKRRRPAKSCDQCRNRKVRCDLTHPCGPCRRARSTLACSYQEGVRAAQQSPAPNVSTLPRRNSGGAYAPIDTAPHSPLESLVREIPQESAISVTGLRDDATIDGLQKRVELLEEELLLIRQTTGTQQRDTIQGVIERLEKVEQRTRSFDRDSHHRSAATDLFVPPIPPRLRAVPEKTKLYGPTHWLHTAEQIHVIGKFSDREAEPDFTGIRSGLRDSFKETRSLRHFVKRQQQPRIREDSVGDLVSTVPSRVVCDALLSSYLETLEPLYRIIQIPLFKEEYEDFWLHSMEVKRSFLNKLLLILAIGTTFHDDEAEFRQLRITARIWVYAAQSWLTGPTEKTTLNLEGVQVFCLLLIARQTNSLSISPALGPGALLNMAMNMGLHRDPDIFPVLSESQKEMRRRLWTSIVELVLQNCLDTGIPLLLSPQDSDTSPPSELDDDELSLPEESLNGRQSSKRFTDTSIQLVMQKSLALRQQVVRMLNGLGHEISYERTLKLSAELGSACRDAANFFRHNLTSRNGGNLSPSEFHQKYIDITLRKYLLLLHKPFMVRASTEPKFYMSRKTCLESCMVITSYVDDLQLPSEVLDDFSKLTIRGAGFLRGPLSLDVIASLCLEITTQLNEDGPRTETDPLGALRQAGRKPILDKLEHIKDQLLQIIALGNPSMKRYNFVAAILAQIYALEAGQPIEPAVYAAVKQSLKDSHNALQAAQIGSDTPLESIDNAPTSLSSESFDFDIGSWDSDQFLDPLNLLYTPGPLVVSQFGSSFL